MSKVHFGLSTTFYSINMIQDYTFNSPKQVSEQYTAIQEILREEGNNVLARIRPAGSIGSSAVLLRHNTNVIGWNKTHMLLISSSQNPTWNQWILEGQRWWIYLAFSNRC